ncbi:hypothetical protein AB0N79_13080 [Streptomyces microflavus]|uniref:hypothetical protein n=1 Tax=Streptomyces microflavus TaxID=1919 RepID=UPI0034298833
MDEIPVQAPRLGAVQGREAVQRGEVAALEGGKVVDAILRGAARSVAYPDPAVLHVQGRGDAGGTRDGVEHLDLRAPRVHDGAGGERDTADALAVGEAAGDGGGVGLQPEVGPAVGVLDAESAAVADAPQVHGGADGAVGSDLADAEIAPAVALGTGYGGALVGELAAVTDDLGDVGQAGHRVEGDLLMHSALGEPELPAEQIDGFGPQVEPAPRVQAAREPLPGDGGGCRIGCRSGCLGGCLGGSGGGDDRGGGCGGCGGQDGAASQRHGRSTSLTCCDAVAEATPAATVTSDEPWHGMRAERTGIGVQAPFQDHLMYEVVIFAYRRGGPGVSSWPPTHTHEADGRK